jgi:cytochrome c-type biogenesis protein CcmH/NrfF
MRHHDLDAVSLAFGLLFVAVGLALLSGDPARGTMSLAWAGPVVAIGIGLLVVLAARPRREEAVDHEPHLDHQPKDFEA